jgi:hypothetical protein
MPLANQHNLEISIVEVSGTEKSADGALPTCPTAEAHRTAITTTSTLIRADTGESLRALKYKLKNWLNVTGNASNGRNNVETVNGLQKNWSKPVLPQRALWNYVNELIELVWRARYTHSNDLHAVLLPSDRAVRSGSPVTQAQAFAVD